MQTHILLIIVQRTYRWFYVHIKSVFCHIPLHVTEEKLVVGEFNLTFLEIESSL